MIDTKDINVVRCCLNLTDILRARLIDDGHIPENVICDRILQHKVDNVRSQMSSQAYGGHCCTCHIFTTSQNFLNNDELCALVMCFIAKVKRTPTSMSSRPFLRSTLAHVRACTLYVFTLSPVQRSSTVSKFFFTFVLFFLSGH